MEERGRADLRRGGVGGAGGRGWTFQRPRGFFGKEEPLIRAARLDGQPKKGGREGRTFAPNRRRHRERRARPASRGENGRLRKAFSIP